MWSVFTDYNDADKQETRHIYMKIGLSCFCGIFRRLSVLWDKTFPRSLGISCSSIIFFWMPLIEGYILDISAVTYSNFVSKICHSMNKGANKKLPFLIFLKSNPRTLTHRPSLNLPRSLPGFKLLLGVSICMKQMSLKITAFTVENKF